MCSLRRMVHYGVLDLIRVCIALILLLVGGCREECDCWQPETSSDILLFDYVLVGDSQCVFYDTEKHGLRNSFKNCICGSTTKEFSGLDAGNRVGKHGVIILGTNNTRFGVGLGDYGNIVKTLKSRTFGVACVGVGPNDGTYSSMDSIVASNALIRSECEKNGGTYVDILDTLSCGDKICSEYTTDGLHFSDDGYKVISGLLLDALSSKDSM